MSAISLSSAHLRTFEIDAFLRRRNQTRHHKILFKDHAPLAAVRIPFVVGCVFHGIHRVDIGSQCWSKHPLISAGEIVLNITCYGRQPTYFSSL